MKSLITTAVVVIMASVAVVLSSRIPQLIKSPAELQPNHLQVPSTTLNRRTTQERTVRSEMPSLESLSPKRFFDFLTDPSLLITVLHSLEVAYWTFPFGFILTPVINFFRVPNRRRSLQLTMAEKIIESIYSQETQSSKRSSSDDSSNFYSMWRRVQSLPPHEQQQLHDLYVKFLRSLGQQDKLKSLGAQHHQYKSQKLESSPSPTRLRK